MNTTATEKETDKERLERMWSRCGCGGRVARVGNMLVCVVCVKTVVEEVRR